MLSKLLFLFCIFSWYGIFGYHSTYDQKKVLAFPGAEGFGCFTSGGRNGMVVEVANLNDSGDGSLREALNSYPNDPLTIVFRVSGIIELKSDLRIKRSNLTIAGQTAPGDGICLKGRSLIINGASGIKDKNHGNIIIRYLRSRPGARLPSGSYGIDIENAHDIIIDHCSFSWANEECAALYDVKNVSFQWCIISEGLYDAGHAKGKRSYGGVWGGQRVSFHHNLIADQNSRTVRFNGARAHDTTALVDYRYNVVYNWGTENACYGGEVEINGGSSAINLVNNYYLPGPATVSRLKFVKANYNAQKAKGLGTWYLKGNIMQNDSLMTKNNDYGIDLSELPSDVRKGLIKDQPFYIEKYAVLNSSSAQEAFTAVMKNAGANFPRRDAVDRRIVLSILNPHKAKTNSFKQGIIDSPEQVGGWPEYKSERGPKDDDQDGMADKWERSKRLKSTDPADRNTMDINGYTMIELYINSLLSKRY